MHIVLVCREFTGSLRAGGIGSYMEEIARAYVHLGNKVTIVTASDDTRCESQYVRDGFRVICLAGGDFFCSGVEPGSKLKKLRLVYRFHSYRMRLKCVIESLPDVDIVEVADYGAEALYLQELRVPVVIRLHTPLSLSRANLVRIQPRIKDFRRYFGLKAEDKIFRNAKYITSCSQALFDWLKDNFELHLRESAVIKNPVAPIHIDNIGDRSSELSIFYAGTISDTKGIGDLIEACRILRNRGFDFTLKLAGKGGSYCDALKHTLNVENADWCQFLGKLPREEVFRYYSSATVCCFPSWWENMPMVVLEAMSLGAVVVSTDSGGTKEIITDGLNGFLVPRRTLEKLANALERAINLPEEERKRITCAARQEIISCYSPDFIAKQMLAFFNLVIAVDKSYN